MILLADVALPVPLPHPFTYEVPQGEELQVGARVRCPFGARRKLVGVVLRLYEGEPRPGLKSLERLGEDQPGVPDELLRFLLELADYYLAPVGEVMRLGLPPQDPQARGEPLLQGRSVQWAVRKPVLPCAESLQTLSPQTASLWAHLREVGEAPVAALVPRWKSARSALKTLEALGCVQIDLRLRPHDPFFQESVQKEPPPTLTHAQAEAGSAVRHALEEGTSQLFVLHGVTGSGKTEVYLQAIAVARAQGGGALMLVPEIVLTPQLVQRFRARFGDQVAVLHSGLTMRERQRMWQRLRSGEVDVAIGARSALFAPLVNLRLLVVDEEHDGSFKQEEGVRYHARDMAILRSHRAGAVCILGSATPSLESEQWVRTGKAVKLRLPVRAQQQALPRVMLVDLRRIGAGPTGDRRISLPLHRALEETLAQHEQAILLLNRRGFAPSVRCQACGELVVCPLCSVSLTFHKKDGARLCCHYCAYQEPMRTACHACQAPSLLLEGLGTEKLEETLRTAFPTARIARLDRDVGGGGKSERILARMHSRSVDILVGTQMVAKGHDLPHVTLVGVVQVDAALSLPDFRASEKTFQLVVQVAGRAGRGEKPGRVLVQTYAPEHPALLFGARHDVDGFAEAELLDRKALHYPPFVRLALVRIEAVSQAHAASGAEQVAEKARRAAEKCPMPVQVVGPAPAPMERLRNRYRFRVLVRSPHRPSLRAVLKTLEDERKHLPSTVRMILDIDPVHLL